MKTFFEWLKESLDSIFPEKPKNISNPEGRPTMFRIERWSKYIKDSNDLDGGDIFFFDTWEEALNWMERDYYENSGWFGMDKKQRIEFNIEHGVFYKSSMEIGSAEAHNEFGY